MEVYEILEFKREKDSWICSECDTENSLLINKCSVCGEMKKSGSKILRAQNKEEKPVTPPEKDNPLLSSPYTIVTPHTAWTGKEARRVLIEETGKNIQAWKKGERRNRLI